MNLRFVLIFGESRLKFKLKWNFGYFCVPMNSVCRCILQCNFEIYPTDFSITPLICRNHALWLHCLLLVGMSNGEKRVENNNNFAEIQFDVE